MNNVTHQSQLQAMYTSLFLLPAKDTEYISKEAHLCYLAHDLCKPLKTELVISFMDECMKRFPFHLAARK